MATVASSVVRDVADEIGRLASRAITSAWLEVMHAVEVTKMVVDKAHEIVVETTMRRVHDERDFEKRREVLKRYERAVREELRNADVGDRP